MNPERELFARDRRQLLARWARKHEQQVPGRPVRALAGVLEMLGYTIVDGPLPGSRIGWTDFARREIVIADNLAEKLDHDTADINAIRHSTLGHELGHVRGLDDCRDCDTYAAVFLVPYREIEQHPVLPNLRRASDPRKVWRHVFELARDFGVSGTLMRRALCEFGWCTYDYESRTLAVVGVTDG